jgi:hypothetical protein
VVLKFPELHHFATGKVTGGVLCNPTFFSSSQVSERLTNQLPLLG